MTSLQWIGVAVFIVVLFGIGYKTGIGSRLVGPPKPRTFDWLATGTAPKSHPVYILTSYFELIDGDLQTIPSDSVLMGKWGEAGSLQLIGADRKPAPKALQIRWFDLRSLKGYGGRLELDSAAMEARMEQGFRDEETDGIYPFKYLVVGVAPGGELALWGSGKSVTHLISMHALPEVPIPLSEMANDPAATYESFAETYFALHHPEDQLLVRDPATAVMPPNHWATLSKRYPYKITVVGEFAGDVLDMNFVNGEREWFDLSSKRKFSTSSLRADLPKPLSGILNWSGPTGVKFYATLRFDQSELAAAFEDLKLKSLTEPAVLELRPDESTLKVLVTLKVGDQVRSLEKVQSGIWARE